MLLPKFLILLILPLLFWGCRENSVPTTNIEPTPRTAEGLIKVTSPTYTENWYPGTKQTIRWDFEEDITHVDILLYRKDIKIMSIANGVENTSHYVWNVPYGLNYSHHYRIKVVNALNKKAEDYSDYFYIIGNLEN